MPIVFSCGCGRSLRVGDGHAGTRVRCPACGNPATVPQLEGDGFDVVNDEPPKVTRVAVAKPVTAKAVEKPIRVVSVAPPAPPEPDFEVVDDEEEDIPPKRKNPFNRSASESDKFGRPQRRNKRRKSEDEKAGGWVRLFVLLIGIGLVFGGFRLAYYLWDSDITFIGKGMAFSLTLIISGFSCIYGGMSGDFSDDSNNNQ